MPRDFFAACLTQVKAQLWPVAIFSLAVNLLMLVSSIYMQQVFDRVLSSGSVDTLVWLTVAAALGIGAYGLIEHARRRLLARIGTWIEIELSEPVIRRGIDARLAGVRSEASQADVADLKGFLSGEAILAFLDAPWMPVFIVVVWLMHPALGMLAVGGALLLFLLAVGNDLLTRTVAAQAAAGSRALQVSSQQAIEYAETLRPLGMVDSLLTRWRQQQRLVHAKMHASLEVTEAVSNITKTVRLALQVFILGIGAYLTLRGELSSGGMIAASIVLGRALSPVERALGAWRSWVMARRAYHNLKELFAVLPDRRPPMPLPPPKGLLTLEAVRFATPGAAEPILQRVDARIEAGTTCGLIGPSGSGKSTLCRLIVGAWQPTNGHVRLDGAEIGNWDPAALGRHVGYLPQQVELFAGTVAENIARLGTLEPEAVARAARLADVHEMILRLPEGYETDVGVHGHRLSGGQRQRLGLARALYGDPALVVLDEPNASLDTAGERALMGALAELKRLGRTVLIVAHQPNMLRTADTVLMLKDGLVDGFGPRDEILRQIIAQVQNGAGPDLRGRATAAGTPGMSLVAGE
ncbi:transporter HasD [Methylobacterium gregans]|uniref:Type I secretion system ATP-binding protein PrsD n=1 Tax=Methylobacterium gregans TaxID=374424 RepID=A0AA37HKS7_9HYPH|nr:type I secretion system permease/ATPase [Methylobacterium gregans]GJD77532.1 Type I secretion system ATP-binding protein PrsD [Methylobacterium gregans]GLS53892.1 transporter HasD [Methylobacterium gregans]